jgi:MFS family permease
MSGMRQARGPACRALLASPESREMSVVQTGEHGSVDSRISWMRLALSVLVATIGNLPMWSVVVALPAVQAEFGTDRASASLPYTATMIGVAIGNIAMGRMVDRMGIALPLILSGIALGLGYAGASLAGNLTQFVLAYGVPIAMLGGAIAFGPLIADLSHWFVRRRGLAVSICAAGNYLAGAIWPPVLEYGITRFGWRETHLACGVLSVVVLLPMALLLHRPAPVGAGMAATSTSPALHRGGFAGLSPGLAQALLCVAGVACCVAMSMPQVHLVAYCGDLGYGPARGAQMLSLMLGMGIISRIGSGFIADWIGGLRTLLLGSALQLTALLLYLRFDGLVSLYIISGLFGLFQGGIVPSYAIIVREYFPPREAGARIGMVLTCTMLGMALGGWMSGAIFDATGSYHIAFANGIAWNLLNLSLAAILLWQTGRPRRRWPEQQKRDEFRAVSG